MRPLVLLAALILAGPAAGAAPVPWRFAVVADTHVAPGATAIPGEVVAAALADAAELVLVPGDVVQAGRRVSQDELRAQLDLFRAVVAPLAAAGIPVYPVRGNHESDARDGLALWDEAFSGAAALPSNGPAGEVNLTYSFVHRNALFVGLDEYVGLHGVNQAWLDGQLAGNDRPHVFVFGHEPAFKAFHEDGLDDYPGERDAFWQSLARGGARVYLCGHDHFFDVARIDDGDGDEGNDLYQAIVGTGGGELFTRHSYDGDNSAYTPRALYHEAQHGYLLVEVGGAGGGDLGVTLTWKRRVVDPATGAASYVPAWSSGWSAAGAGPSS